MHVLSLNYFNDSMDTPLGYTKYRHNFLRQYSEPQLEVRGLEMKGSLGLLYNWLLNEPRYIRERGKGIAVAI